MAYKLCVLGNSHTAAVKQAWEKYPPPVAKGVRVSFFAAANKTLEKLVYRAGKLEANDRQLKRKLLQTAGTKGPIDLAAYDAILLVGLGLDTDVTHWAGLFGTPEDAKWGEPREVVSEAVFGEIVRYRLSGSLAIRFARDIRRVSQVPMLIASVPLDSEHTLDTKRGQRVAYMGEPGYLGPFVARCRRMAERLMAEHDCEIFWQDDSTVARGGFTRKEFNVNPAVFADRDDPEKLDLDHMNAEFAALTLDKVFARLETLAPGRVLARA